MWTKWGNESHTAASQTGCLVFSLHLLSEIMNSLIKVEMRLDQGGKRKHWGAITCSMRSGSGCFCIWCQQSKICRSGNFSLGDRMWLDNCFSHQKKKSLTNRNPAERVHPRLVTDELILDALVNQIVKFPYLTWVCVFKGEMTPKAAKNNVSLYLIKCF